jgi:lysophospholipase L1-like esterase
MGSVRFRSVLCVLVLASPACVIRLSERNAPAENGAVTGGAANCAAVTVPPHGAPGGEPATKIVGRVDARDPQALKFDWSGTYFSARFEAPAISARLETTETDVLFSATLDGGEPVRVHVLSANAQPDGFVLPQTYTLFTNLSPGPHEVVLHRDTEAQSGVTIFRGFELGGGRLLPPTQRARRIEVIGDSITCGYGNLGANATCPFDLEVRPRKGECPPPDAVTADLAKDYPTCEIVKVPVTESQYKAYSAIAGRMLDADVVTTCWSGKGVERNYRERSNDPNRLATMPDLWRERTIAGKPNAPPEAPAEQAATVGVAWDFTTEPEPQVVLINLGTNDFTRDVLKNNEGNAYDGDNGDNVPDGDIDLVKFRDTYLAFVRDVRAKRPNAHIFLALPPMVTDQYPIDDARSNLYGVLLYVAAELERAGDTKVYAMTLVEQGTRYGLGCDYHPNERVHEIMAEQVAGAIRSKTCWD